MFISTLQGAVLGMGLWFRWTGFEKEEAHQVVEHEENGKRGEDENIQLLSLI